MSLPQNYNLLKRYPNPVYVETGVYRGDSLQLAHEAGFKKIVGIDNDPASINFCLERFDLMRWGPDGEMNKIISLVGGDSATCLWDAIKDVEVPMTILLDAHYQLIEGTERGEHPFPLLDEIAQIAKHPVKSHTIIVDDLLHLTHPMITGWNYTDILKALNEVNPAYHFDLLANPVINNLLVAHL